MQLTLDIDLYISTILASHYSSSASAVHGRMRQAAIPFLLVFRSVATKHMADFSSDILCSRMQF
jgi:hypothetical protein